jgi:hypothetical protein
MNVITLKKCQATKKEKRKGDVMSVNSETLLQHEPL